MILCKLDGQFEKAGGFENGRAAVVEAGRSKTIGRDGATLE